MALQTELALRLAASEARLEKHQQAYVMLRGLLASLHNSSADNQIGDCFRWFDNNNLYLAGGARSAFWEACVAARDFRLLRPGYMADKTPEQKSQLEANFEKVLRAPERIAEAIDLPTLSKGDIELMQKVAEEETSVAGNA